LFYFVISFHKIAYFEIRSGNNDDDFGNNDENVGNNDKNFDNNDDDFGNGNENGGNDGENYGNGDELILDVAAMDVVIGESAMDATLNDMLTEFDKLTAAGNNALYIVDLI
jgi:hypothetical protein